MRAILEDLRSGELSVHQIPPPELRAGGLLVETHFSVISSGTERAKVEAGEKTLLGKALSRPDLVRQVIDYARTNGIRAAYQKVRSRLDALSFLGYSCAGVVLEVGEGVREFRLGDRVACGGAGYANHSEINFVPQNLAVHVPPSVALEHAAITTLGAIAMHGLRQSQASFGEAVAVIGAGLVGILTIQLARAAGCRVIAIDIDPRRAERSTSLGAHVGLAATDARIIERVREFSSCGADAAIITAASPSSAPVELATKILRDRGRIVIVGDVALGVSRASLYAKELSLVLSRSYGPGRYDTTYEERGVDYPIGYVRWTEKRNMEAFLQALAGEVVDVSSLLERRYSIEDAAKAYSELRTTGAYTALIEYAATPRAQPVGVAPAKEETRRLHRSTELRVCCIGAGGFARDVIFPYLRAAKQVILESVATGSGATAESARRTFGFSRAERPIELVQNPETDLVFVLSQHDSHAHYVATALNNQKPVFVEKPLVVNRQQLTTIQEAYQAQQELGRSPFLMVGFNRRFAPFTSKLREFFAQRQEPLLAHIRVNAGYIPREHWTQQDANGGRIVGELCHFVDWARSVINVPIVRVWAAALPDGARYNRDNVSATLLFCDGSIANLLYLANGDKAMPKEYFEVFCEGSVARLDDFRRLELTRVGKTQCITTRRDKGHHRELALTLDAVRVGRKSPIPFDELVEVTKATLAIGESIDKGESISLDASQPIRLFEDGGLPVDSLEASAGTPQGDNPHSAHSVQSGNSPVARGPANTSL